MISLAELRSQLLIKSTQVFQVQTDLNIFDSPQLKALATQAGAGRYLRFLPLDAALSESTAALLIQLQEDDYPGWLAVADLVHIIPASRPYSPPTPTAGEIQSCLPEVIQFCLAAMQQPNTYLWGGTVGPNYDCSGLVQHSFATYGIWLPRDAYQQEAFTQAIANPGSQPEDLIPALLPGDLIFFGTPQKATHVAIHLENGEYIHSSGQQQGRNGIGLDQLRPKGHPVSQAYYAQFRGAGRVITSYRPQQ